MKKMLVGALLCALLLSLCGVTASALTVEETFGAYSNTFWGGQYSTTDKDFSPVGTVKIEWDPDALKKLDLTDGNMADWESAGYRVTEIDASNMVLWVGDASTVPAGWRIKAYFVADSDNLYFGFSITDPTFAYGSENVIAYDGDAIQLSMDFGRRLGDQLEYDPEVILSPKNVFYSFDCDGDGAPISIMRQESDQDGTLTEDDGVKGTTFKTADGWCAEFSISYDRLFIDYAWKDWDEGEPIYMGGYDHVPFKIGCCLYYLDRHESVGSVEWAAGTTNGITFADGTPAVSWTAYDNGLQLELDYVEGMEINSIGVRVLHPEPLTTEEYTNAIQVETTEELVESDEYYPVDVETAPIVEFPTEPAVEPETYIEPDEEMQTDLSDWQPVTTKPATQTTSPSESPVGRPESDDSAPTTMTAEHVTTSDDGDHRAEEIQNILNKYGCNAVLSISGLTLLLTMAAAAVICRRKH